MTKQVIVTDSTSDLSAEYLNQHNIHVVPLNLTIDKESFVISRYLIRGVH